ncbi:MAG TPA: nucleoside/nucleotide kinase family protein [Micromonosporaceae bacterium]
MQPDLLDQAATVVAGCHRTGARTMVGITGPPGAGKSTLAEALASRFAAAPTPAPGQAPGPGPAQAPADPHGAVVVPMDGFHLSNVELTRLGLVDRKGAPETFDADGFVHLLSRIRAGRDLVYAPAYSRVLHESIGGAIPVPADAELVLVEGNYLLLPQPPWVRARPYLDLVLYLDVPAGPRLDGLVRRHMARGLDRHAAMDFVTRSDEANTRLVESTRQYADVIITRGDESDAPAPAAGLS